jgi:predicted ArsR family transcriptional regulator
MLEFTKIDIQLRTHKVTKTRDLILVIAKTEDQIIMIDLADETRIPRY